MCIIISVIVIGVKKCTYWPCDLDLWPLDPKPCHLYDIPRSFAIRSLNSLVSFAFKLCSRQTNRQTDRQTDGDKHTTHADWLSACLIINDSQKYFIFEILGDSNSHLAPEISRTTLRSLFTTINCCYWNMKQRNATVVVTTRVALLWLATRTSTQLEGDSEVWGPHPLNVYLTQRTVSQQCGYKTQSELAMQHWTQCCWLLFI